MCLYYAPSAVSLACTLFCRCTPCHRYTVPHTRRSIVFQQRGSFFLGEKTKEVGSRPEHCSDVEV